PTDALHPAEDQAEEVRERGLVPEQILQILRAHFARVAAVAGRRLPLLPVELAGPPALLPTLVLLAQLVVLAAPLRITQRLVRFVDDLEPLLRGLVARVHVGMVLTRQLAIGALDGGLVSVGRDAQIAVVVSELHALPVPPVPFDPRFAARASLCAAALAPEAGLYAIG